MSHDPYENDHYDDETEDFERIKRQCISYDDDMTKDYINPLHCVPYTIINSNGTSQIRYSLSKEYFTYLCEISKPSTSSSLFEEEQDIECLFDSEITSHDSLPYVPPIPLPPSIVLPKLTLKQPKQTNQIRKTNSPFFMRSKSFSRLHALKCYFAGILPSTRPLCVQADEWDTLQLSYSGGTLLMFDGFGDGCVSVRTYPSYDSIIHAAVIHGRNYSEQPGMDHTRFRWWSDSKVIGFSPIHNLRKNYNRGGLRVTVPEAITTHPYLLELYKTLRHQELGRIISKLINLYIEKLVGKATYDDYTLCGFKYHGKAVRITRHESPEVFKSIIMEYFLNKQLK